MKVIYEFRKEIYELSLTQDNADNGVIECFEKNKKKATKNRNDLLHEADIDFFNFDMFQPVSYSNTGKKENPNRQKSNCTDITEEIKERISDVKKEKTKEDEVCGKYEILYAKCKTYFEKTKKYIVKDGSIYGAEFVLYLADETFMHSLYIIYFVNEQKVLRDLIKILRVSHSLKKKTILILDYQEKNVDIADSIVYIILYSYKGEKEKKEFVC